MVTIHAMSEEGQLPDNENMEDVSSERQIIEVAEGTYT